MKDVARLIWEMSKADRSLDGLELKGMFHKKVQLDQEELRLKLKELVAKQIKKEPQPYKAEIVLSADTKSEFCIFGAIATIKSQNGRPSGGSGKQCVDKFTYQTATLDWVEVTNIETQMLIDAAIVPLGLKWKIQSPNYNNAVAVSWRHWNDDE